jgi:hypothetical protein
MNSPTFNESSDVMKCRYLDSFGIERVMLLEGISFNNLKNAFQLLTDDEISKLKYNPIINYSIGKYIQFIELDNNIAIINLRDKIYEKSGYLIDLKNITVDKNVICVVESDNSIRIKSARNI